MANRTPTSDELNGVKQDTVQWEAKAHRVTSIDENGNEIDIATKENQINGNQISQDRLYGYNFDDKEWQIRAVRDRAAHYCLIDATINTGIVMIDKSDTINFPHKNTNRIDIGAYQISINGDVNWAGFVGIGFIEEINSDNATICVTNCWQFDKRSGRSVDQTLSRNNRMKGSSEFVVSGPPKIITYMNTGSINSTPAGITTPEVGDWVLLAEPTSGSVSIGLTFKYTSN